MIDAMRQRKAVFCKNKVEYSALPRNEQARVDEIDNCISDLINAPDAEPERKMCRKFFEIAVNYPKICTYPEYEGKPYYSIIYEENGEMITGFGTYKPEVLSQYLREYFISPAEPVERTAKAISDDVIITVNGYRYHHEEYLCNACKKKVFSCDSYCSHCGAKLDWSWLE